MKDEGAFCKAMIAVSLELPEKVYTDLFIRWQTFYTEAAAIESERDALRERVAVLEREIAIKCSECPNYEKRDREATHG